MVEQIEEGERRSIRDRGGAMEGEVETELPRSSWKWKRSERELSEKERKPVPPPRPPVLEPKDNVNTANIFLALAR